LRNAEVQFQRIESRCLNDQLEIKVQRIVTARPMSLMGQALPLRAESTVLPHLLSGAASAEYFLFF